MPAVPRADDVLALDGPADPHVGAEVQAVGVQHIELAGLGAEDHQFFAEVVRPLDLAGSQLEAKPTMNQPVGKRYFDRLIPLGPNSRSDGSMVGQKSCPSLPSPSAH